MPPKVSKKTQEKQKAKTVDDKTFGLKNKKGAKQQKFIEQVNKQVYSKSNKEQRKDTGPKLTGKAKKQAYLDELDALLGTPAIKTERKVLISKKQQDADKGKEVVYLTIEELVEVERLKLKNSGKQLTKVTLESFLQWKKKKKAEERKKAEELAKTKKQNQKEGKIMTATGKELFAYYKDKVDLADDEEAAEIELDDEERKEQERIEKEQGGIREITAASFYYEGVDAAINEELFADEDLDGLDDLAAELEGIEFAE